MINRCWGLKQHTPHVNGHAFKKIICKGSAKE